MSINDTSAHCGDSFFATQNGLLQDFDTFVSDSEEFIEQFYVHQKKQPVTVASKLAFWSNRKLGSRLQKILNSLSKREEYFDAHLRGMMDDSLTNVSSLSLQAVHLKSRLSSCIEYNKREMELLGEQMGELQGLSFELSKADKDTKDILHFVNEIIVQGEAQLERNLSYYSVESDAKDVAGFTTKDRSLVIKRLHMIREIQSQTTNVFNEILELYKKHQGILRICQVSHNLFCEIPTDVVYDLSYEPITRGSHGTKPSDRHCADNFSIPLGDPSTSLTISQSPDFDRKPDHLMGALERYFLQPDEKLSTLLMKPNSQESSVSKKLCTVNRSSSGNMKKGSISNGGKGGCKIKEMISIATTSIICKSCTSMDGKLFIKAGKSLDALIGNSSLPCTDGDRNSDGDCRHDDCPQLNDLSKDDNADRCEFPDSHLASQSLDTLSVSTTVHNFHKRTDGEQKIFIPSGLIEEEKDEDIAYDHTQCCDCSVVDDLARDCITRLSVMHRKAAESFGRLEKLLKIREDLININMSVRGQKSF